ncbi:YfiR family protein [Massilia niastensis]|uniref:YfiR family protein n=1 Tax=Massilia niastensis TaxID=544911 RepID=UPI000378D985|nr:YfiR family protein [Massilia niastensis]
MSKTAQPGRPSLAAFALACLLSVCAGLPWCAPALAADSAAVASEDSVKAAYLHKFLNYAEWPSTAFARADAPYVIGVAGDDAVADELARIAAGKTVGNRGVVIKRVFAGETLNDLHMLFIGRGERPRQAQWLRQSKGRTILVVTDDEGSFDEGSIINFRIVDERVRFEVSIPAAEQNRLQLSSRLFSVATRVIKGSH